MSYIHGEFPSPAAIPSTHAEGNERDGAVVPITLAAHLRKSANTLDARKILDNIGGGRKAPPKANFQSFDSSFPQCLIEVRRKDQRGDASPQPNDRGARATVVHNCAATRKDSCVIHRAHHLDVVRMEDMAQICSAGANQRPLP
jgi:hypothetical protein